MTSSAERVRGAGAVAALLALTTGVPWALVMWGGTPWPRSAPSTAWITDPLSSAELLGMLVIVMWCAWAHFVVSVVREFVAQRRTHQSDRVISGGHPVARRLVASVLLMVGTVTVGGQAAQADEHAGPAPTNVSVVSDVVHGAHQVGRAAERAAERAADRAEGGSTTRSLHYTVQPPHARHHDSLWDIAERTLGDGRRWTELYELNKDRVQDDGTSLKDADLIYPGWDLVLPDDARGADVEPMVATPSGGSTEAQVGAQQAEPQPTPAVVRADADTEPTPLSSEPAASSSEHARDDIGPDLAVTGGLIAAGVLLGLRRRRGRGGWPPRGRGTTPPYEQTLHLGADVPAAEVADRGLRRLSSHLARPSAATPVLRNARVSADAFTAVFERVPTQDPPAGWAVLGDGRVWYAPAEALCEPPTPVASAYPDTVVVGTDAGEHILVNLRGSGDAVTIGGDSGDVEMALRALTVGLATQAWGDGLTVVAAEIPGVDPGPALAAGRLIAVDGQADAAMACADSLDPSPVAVVVGTPGSTPELDQAVAALIANGRTVAVVRASSDPRTDLKIDPQGRLTGDRPPVVVETAARLGEDSARRLLALYEDAPAAGSRSPVIPELDLDPAPSTASLQLLGPVAVRASAAMEPERAELVTEILVYLALNPGGTHSSVLAGAIWPRGVDEDVLNATMRRVATFLQPPGTARDPVLRCNHGRWSLDPSRVHVDWNAFRALVDAADRVDRPTERLEHALTLVAGAPLDGLPPHRYGWLSTLSVRQDITRSIVQCAERLGADSDVVRAEWALRTGLRAAPTCEPLWHRLLRLSHQSGAPVEPVADEMYTALARHGSSLGAEATTDALVRELLPSYALPVRAGQLSA